MPRLPPVTSAARTASAMGLLESGREGDILPVIQLRTHGVELAADSLHRVRPERESQGCVLRVERRHYGLRRLRGVAGLGAVYARDHLPRGSHGLGVLGHCPRLR